MAVAASIGSEEQMSMVEEMIRREIQETEIEHKKTFCRLFCGVPIKEGKISACEYLMQIY